MRLGPGFEHFVQTTDRLTFVELMGRSLSGGHVDEQHIPLAGFRQAACQSGCRGGDAGAPAQARDRDELRLVREVAALEIADEAVPERFVKRLERIGAAQVHGRGRGVGSAVRVTISAGKRRQAGRLETEGEVAGPEAWNREE